jgi:uncharacterized protein YbbC (DUF1343 family)
MIVFDIQDVGVRYYTYIWALWDMMIAAAALNIPVVVLDRYVTTTIEILTHLALIFCV